MPVRVRSSPSGAFLLQEYISIARPVRAGGLCWLIINWLSVDNILGFSEAQKSLILCGFAGLASPVKSEFSPVKSDYSPVKSEFSPVKSEFLKRGLFLLYRQKYKILREL